MLKENHSKQSNIQSRPPVVVILGHVDHGKSSLLEAIKDLKITKREAGGITQHIGAYEIEEKSGKITFIDTPGHEAFSAMRARGAKIADIAILVVAADEGVKPQTKEAIFHIKKANIPMIVAINKIDKPGANPTKVKQELAKAGVLVESLGGKIPSVETSAVTGRGINDLLEMILLVAGMENLKADISKPGQGVVIESYLDHFKGPVATLILNEGTLEKGQIIATPSTLGKIRGLENFQGMSIDKAFPSQPAVVIGFEKVPYVGENFRVFSDREKAQAYLNPLPKKTSGLLEVPPDKKVLNLVIKTDVLGSIEAVENVLKEIPQDRVVLRILKSEVGNINETDIKESETSKAVILGFRVKINPSAKRLLERSRVKIMLFDVIYDLIEGIRKLMDSLFQPEMVRVDLGKVRILAKFWAKKNRQIVGGRVIEGEVRRGSFIEVYRSEDLIGKGKLINLQIEKKNVDKVPKGKECGILYEGDARIEEGDILLFYTQERRRGI